MSMSTQKFGAMTMANRPSAASYGVGYALITDRNNTLFYSDGSRWVPVESRVDNPLKITSIGDSNSARGSYHPQNIDWTLTKAPLWAANTSGWRVGMIMRNSNNTLYYASAITTGITASSEPTHVTGGVADGGVTWTAYNAYSGRDIGSFQRWAEYWSNGAIVFDQRTGWAAPEYSLIKGFVVDGGKNYTNPKIRFTPDGATADLVVTNGVITAVNITNSGRNATGALSYTITDTTGSGAVLSFAHTNNGTFAVSGTTTTDMLQLVPDAVASDADIVTVLGGSNDITLNANDLASAETVYQTAISNLKQIYEGLVAGGKKVIAITIAPRVSQLTSYQLGTRKRINRFIRAFARKETWANPNKISIALADPVAWTTDNSTAGVPATDYTISDGLHYSTKMGMVVGYFVAKAAERWTGNAMQNYPRAEGWGDGYSRSYNPEGNMLEGLYWTANTPYVVGDYCNNDTNKIYRCTVAGTSASSGGPTGTGTPTDGTVTWAYVRAGGTSCLASGVGGTNTAASGVVFTSTPPAGMTLARQNGTASGTVIHSVENPRSDGRQGQRHVMAFSLGSGGATEQWRLLIGNPAIATAGILASDLNNKLYTLEVELELSSYANIYPPFIQLFAQSDVMTNYDGWGIYSVGQFMGAGCEMLPSTHELAWPSTKKMLLRTTPTWLPYGSTALNSAIYFGFNASGGAGSATATVKLNHICIRQVPA